MKIAGAIFLWDSKFIASARRNSNIRFIYYLVRKIYGRFPLLVAHQVHARMWFQRHDRF
jgi:hypothetical protein